MLYHAIFYYIFNDMILYYIVLYSDIYLYFIFIFRFIFVFIFTNKYTHTYIYIYVYEYVYVYFYVCVYIYIHIHTRVHIYTTLSPHKVLVVLQDCDSTFLVNRVRRSMRSSRLWNLG